MTIAAIRESRAAKVATMRNLLTTAETEKRSLNAGEQSAFDVLKADITGLEAAEGRATFLEEAERRALGHPVSDKHAASLERSVNVVDVIRAQMEGRALSGAAAEYQAETERRTGRKAQGVFVPMAALEQRVTTTGTAPEIVPTNHRHDQYIDPLRNSLLARKLGVRVLSGLTGNVTMPKFGTGTTSGWVAENAALTPSDMTFDPVTMAPKHAGGLVEMSRQLIQQSSPDVDGLLALMLLHQSRAAARAGADGAIILLEDQDRTAWNRDLAAEGAALAALAFARPPVGSYTIQALIAAVHAAAREAGDTDWARIVALYDLLLRAEPSPVVALNRAVAVAMRNGPEAGLALIDPLATYRFAHAARADLLRRLGRSDEARAAYAKALELTEQEAERQFIEGRIAELGDPSLEP